MAAIGSDAGMIFVHDSYHVRSRTLVNTSRREMAGIIWNGTLIEQLDLVAAVEHQCECIFDVMGIRLGFCPAHIMLVRDQRALDGLLWSRRRAKQRLAEEGINTP